MEYRDFLKKINKNQVHFSDIEAQTDEPLYAIKTSGTLDQKTYVHSLSGIKKSCESFLNTFSLDKKDRWGVCLPMHHVSGLSIFFRSYFGELKEPYVFNWDKQNIVQNLKEQSITVLSLVPTQIYDLVSKKIKAPQDIKYVFVGGSKLSQNLLAEAKKLNWPVVCCYGSTETFAQMSYSYDGENYKTFSGWTVSQDKEGAAILKGPGLYYGEIVSGKLIKNQYSFLKTQDFIESINDTEFKLLGRSDEKVKIKGSYFDFANFKEALSKFMLKNQISQSNYCTVLIEEERNGYGVYLVSEQQDLKNTQKIFDKFSELRGVFYISKIPRTDLGKIKINLLSKTLGKEFFILNPEIN